MRKETSFKSQLFHSLKSPISLPLGSIFMTNSSYLEIFLLKTFPIPTLASIHPVSRNIADYSWFQN